jgi:hypothetical protein
VLVALVVGCGGHSESAHESLADVDPSAGYWTLRATCDGRRFDVDFVPDSVSADGLGHASKDEIAVECGRPERVAVSDEELRNGTPTGAELTEPTSEPTELSCDAGGELVVEAHPVWASEGVVGSALRIRRGDLTILDGAVPREDSAGLSPELRWLHSLCRPD